MRETACWLAALTFLLGCTEERREPESLTVGTQLYFESVDATGITTDNASTGGVSWVDYDGDDDLDLFVTNGYDVSAEIPAGQPNRVYRNEGKGEFVEITAGALATSNGISSGNTWGDYDNDGDLDVFIANQQDQNNFLYRNEGDGKFIPIDDEPQCKDGGHSYAATWVDVDGDGWLDLFVANGGMSHVGRNGLYRGTGDGHFQKITDGNVATDEAATCGIAWGDYDNDGDVDLFLANTGFSPPANNNVLYRNDGNWKFARIDAEVTRDGLPSCAATWVDIDNDLDLDLHVTNMYGLANLLYVNDGTGALSVVEGSPLTLNGGHSYGANWEDFDNDGDLDVVVANWGAGPDVYVNNGSGRFERRRAGDLGGRIQYAGAMASADYDADGDVDVLIGNWPNRPGPEELNALFANSGNDSHWLRVRLKGTTSNKFGIGARILLTWRRGTEMVTQMREVTTQMGFRGQSDIVSRFGLGNADEALSIVIRWPSGKTSNVSNVDVDQTVEISEE